ncbi:FkbM family methyltransferase [Ramlibacter sp. PS3R-8]|uniref:FkbM family methyltransferase n=1 Tax=Ramlibacter sp. PS3R-8 TaxID=3133437 RepID=UPI0030AC7762
MKAVKQALRAVAQKVAPDVMHRRAIDWAAAREAELRLLPFLCRPGTIAVDVGANIGLYLEHLLPLAGHVMAFEPNPTMAEVVRRFYPQAQLEPVALADKEGRAEFRMPAGNASWGTLATTNQLEMAQVPIESFAVPMRTLDSYGLHGLGFVKIDVEGFEEAVVAGAVQTLQRERPNLLIEIEERHNPGSVHRMADTLGGLGYSAFFLSDGELQPFARFDLTRDQPKANVGLGGKQGRYINNFMFVPAFRAVEFTEALQPRTDHRLVK